MASSNAYDGKCPHCGHTFTLADLRHMAVGDGWQRYIRVQLADASIKAVAFDDFDPGDRRSTPPFPLHSWLAARRSLRGGERPPLRQRRSPRRQRT